MPIQIDEEDGGQSVAVEVAGKLIKTDYERLLDHRAKCDRAAHRGECDAVVKSDRGESTANQRISNIYARSAA